MLKIQLPVHLNTPDMKIILTSNIFTFWIYRVFKENRPRRPGDYKVKHQITIKRQNLLTKLEKQVYFKMTLFMISR